MRERKVWTSVVLKFDLTGFWFFCCGSARMQWSNFDAFAIRYHKFVLIHRSVMSWAQLNQHERDVPMKNWHGRRGNCHSSRYLSPIFSDNFTLLSVQKVQLAVLVKCLFLKQSNECRKHKINQKRRQARSYDGRSENGSMSKLALDRNTLSDWALFAFAVTGHWGDINDKFIPYSEDMKSSGIIEWIQSWDWRKQLKAVSRSK